MSAPDLSTARWFKSSRSANNGTCVEAAFLWRKSSRSNNNGACVEVASLPGQVAPDHVAPDQVALRDSKDPTGPVLVFPAGAWAAFVADVKTGGFDLR